MGSVISVLLVIIVIVSSIYKKVVKPVADEMEKTTEVLVEGFSKRSREQLFGRTSQNKVVIFDKGNHRIGEKVWVKIKEASAATLFGEPVDLK